MFLDVAAVRDDPRRRVDGYAIRPVRSDEIAARVEVHRAAWKPSSIPYIDGRAVDPDAESSFTAEAYESVRSAWLYDPSLDLVAVADDNDDGGFGAWCIAWFDPSTGVCEIEPLGVAPEHRRHGRAVALCIEVAALVADRGGTHTCTSTASHSPATSPRRRRTSPPGSSSSRGRRPTPRWAAPRSTSATTRTTDTARACSSARRDSPSESPPRVRLNQLREVTPARSRAAPRRQSRGSCEGRSTPSIGAGAGARPRHPPRCPRRRHRVGCSSAR